MQQLLEQPAATPRARRVPTIGERLEGRCNNFDFIRLFAAYLVLVSHSYFLFYGNNDGEPLRRLSGHDTLGTLAVRTFFIISGLLVARSFLSDPHPLRYMRKRCLRIFPGLVVCIAFCVLVVGPAVTNLTMGEYFGNARTWTFFKNAALHPSLQYDLPGVFVENPQAAVNGSLWSLPLEFMMYIGVLGLGVVGLMKRWPVLIAVGLALLFYVFVNHRINGLGLPNFVEYWLPKVIEFAYFFFAGTAILLFKERVPVDLRLFLVCLVATAATFRTGAGPYVYAVALPYVVMYLSFVRIPYVSATARYGDFSYGTYLYAFPIQQVVLHYMPGVSFVGFILLASFGTLVLSVVSWHGVEKHFLRMKKRTSDQHVPTTACPPVAGTVVAEGKPQVQAVAMT